MKPESVGEVICTAFQNPSEKMVFATSYHPSALLDWSDDHEFLFFRGKVVHLFAVQKEWRNDSIKFEKKLHDTLYTYDTPWWTDARGVLQEK